MSNAAVINATNSSGWTVGSPITIETGGDVVLKAYGTGSGSWSVTLSFAPVVGGVTGSPTTLTIGPNAPSAKTSVTKSDATQWVGWVSQAEGTWQASGLVEGYTDDEALANDLGYFASTANLPTKALKLGAKADTPSGPVTWRGAGGWVAPDYTAAIKRSGSDIIAATGLRAAIFGSSSSAYCGTPQGTAGFATTNWDTAQATSETPSGYWFHANARWGGQFSLALNYGFPSQIASTIANMVTDALANHASEFDVAIFQNLANDLATYSDITASIATARTSLDLLIAAGKKVVIVVPHTRNSVSETLIPNYWKYSTWADSMMDIYPGVVYVANHFRDAFGGQPTPVKYLVDDGTSTHLNIPGCRKAAESWETVFRDIGGMLSENMLIDGVLPRRVDSLSSGGTPADSSVVEGPVDSYGRTSRVITSMKNSSALNKVITMPSASGNWRIVYDYDIDFVADTGVKMVTHPGIYYRCNGVIHKVGMSASTSDNYGKPVVGRYRGVSHRIATSGATAATLAFYPGDAGNICTIRNISIHSAT